MKFSYLIEKINVVETRNFNSSRMIDVFGWIIQSQSRFEEIEISASVQSYAVKFYPIDNETEKKENDRIKFKVRIISFENESIKIKFSDSFEVQNEIINMDSAYISKFNNPVNKGYCTICETDTLFVENGAWYRDQYRCTLCNSKPRHRALINALNIFTPDWRNKIIHESSPGGVSSDFIRSKNRFYTLSHYYKGVECGTVYHGARCENLENLTFEDNSFDIFITQDVFEHIFNPQMALSEIERVLKKGGFHIFTVPINMNLEKSVQRAMMSGDEIEYLLEPVYHGNPIDEKGSLVTYDYGSDFVKFIGTAMSTTIYLEKNRELGLLGEYLYVVISRKY